MSQIPNLPKHPEINQKYYNFYWTGEHWMNLSNGGMMLISSTPPTLPTNQLIEYFWYNPASERLHRHKSNLSVGEALAYTQSASTAITGQRDWV